MIDDEQINKLISRHDELQAELAAIGGTDREAFTRMAKEFSDLSPIVAEVAELRRLRRELADLDAIIADPRSESEMRALAKGERDACHDRLSALETKVGLLLMPKDEADERNAILEVRAGTGGEEAALFAADLFRMYQRYAERRGWTFEVMHSAETGLGGTREGIASISGRGVFARLKFESGVHRVQRVPETEAGGRIHTSAATVAVLPEAEEIDVELDDKDLRIDVFRASGPGGQSVNTTDSAVRITHLPTGIVVQQQDAKSQHKNRAKAFKVLRARLYDRERLALQAERASKRRDQIGTGDRSERVRTYNFPQNRVTEHRINLTLHTLAQVLESEALDKIIEPLIAEDRTRRLAEYAKQDRS